LVRKHRDNLTGEHDAADIGQLALFIVFLAFWISDLFIGYSNFLNRYIPLAARLPSGVLLLASSVHLMISGLRVLFGGRAQPMGVVKYGVLGMVRHPVYLGEMLLYLGLLLLNVSLSAALVWAAGVIFLYYISRYEEKLLLSRFGEEYRRYMKDVPMWLPRFRRTKLI